MDTLLPNAERLRREAEWALRRALDPSEVLPTLHRLVKTAPEGSEACVFAHQNLAELLVERNPWRAALHARKVLAHRPECDRGWAMLALCQTMLGHYRFAVAAYRRALERAPKNPWYAHNLGHLLDVALDDADEAVDWLKTAYARANWNPEIAASYAHALARAGRLEDARKVLDRAMKKAPLREHAALLKWLEQGAPSDSEQKISRPAAMTPRTTALPKEKTRTRKSMGTKVVAELEATLIRGLSNLPLDARQRGRAKDLARDVLRVPNIFTKSTPHSIAAAIAYAIVFVDHVPLTQAEVAGCFRVSAKGLRGRFSELRAHLDLTPGDARYATQRRG